MHDRNALARPLRTLILTGLALLAVWLAAAGCQGEPSVPASSLPLAVVTEAWPEPPATDTATAEPVAPPTDPPAATGEVAAYPGPATVAPPTPSPDAYPAYPAPGATADQTGIDRRAGSIYLPFLGQGVPGAPAPTALPSPTPAPTVTPSPSAVAASPTPAAAAALLAPSPTPIAVVDFGAVASDLAARGEQLAYNKIGFHVTFLEDSDELDGWMQRLDREGVPFFLKSVDNAEPIYKAQELMKASGVPHTLVYRSTLYDVPDYNLDPVVAAEAYWELEKEIWPPELDPSLVWFETMNELDKNRSEWLAAFSLRTAELALRDGYKWAAFGWASGEPEPADWESPTMLQLLRLIGEHPDQLAIALHEYSYTADDIGDDYPYKVGRFLELFRAADAHGIPRPTVLITEWGWTYDHIPPEPLAMEDVTWAARLYGAYPQVKGAAIWNLGKLGTEYGELNDQMQDLIDNMLALSLDTTFSAPAAPWQAPLDPGQFPPP